MSVPIEVWYLTSAPRRPFRADRLADVDEVAVERACRGDRRVTLNRTEMALAFQYLDDHGYSARRIGAILGVSWRSVFRWRSGQFPYSRKAGEAS